MTTGTLLSADEAAPKYPELVEWRKQDQAIAEMREQYLPLTIQGINDKDGFKAVHDARMVVKNTRVAVEKKRVELKADALAYGKAVDAEAKRLTVMLEPIENHLQAEEEAVVQEKARIAREAEEAKQRIIQARINALVEVGVFRSPAVIAAMPQEQYDTLLEESKAAHTEKLRADHEAAEKRKAEEEALSAERQRLAEIERQQQAERDRLAAEQRKLEEERLARERAAELERAKVEAAERAKLEAERRHAEELERIKREAALEKAAAEEKARREKEEAEARERARLKADAERPQRERIEEVARQVERITVPGGAGETAVRSILRDAAGRIRAISKGPLA